MKPQNIILSFLLISAAIGIIYWAFFIREHREWEERVILHNGKKVLVTHNSSQKVYHGHPHLFGWGGGDPWHKMLFKHKGVSLIWEGPYIPIVLDFDEDYPYLVVFDRETNFAKIKFRFYRFDKTWLEINILDFPKHIAIQNMWLRENNGFLDGKVINEYEIVDQLDTNYFPFRRSLTAKMWQRLSVDVKYYESDDEVERSLLEEFKAKYIKDKLHLTK